METKRQKIPGLLRLCIALLISVAVVSAGQDDTENSEGYFFSLSLHALPFDGDLDGAKVLWHIEKAFFIPSLERTAALSVGFGRRRDSGSWDISLLRASQDTFFPGGGMTRLTYYAADLTGRAYLIRSPWFQPYFLLGLSIPWMSISDGAEYQGEVNNTRFVGMGLNLGGGIMLPLGPELFLNTSLSYRLAGFFYAWGGGKGRDVMTMTLGRDGPEWGKWLEASCVSLSIGLGFNF